MKFYNSDDTKKMLLQFLLKSFIAYTRFCVQLKIKYRVAKKQNRIIGLIGGLFEGIYGTVSSAFVYITSNKVEPSDPTWISICRYVPSTKGMYAITYDSYSRFNDRHLKYWPNILEDWKESGYYEVFHSKYMNIYHSFCCFVPSHLDNTLLISKICPTSMRILFASNIRPEVDLSEAVTSSVRFLEVEYKCKNMNGFEIDIPKSHYIAGNEILSKTYILRYLEHLPIYVRWTFDESEYELRIVDEDSNVFSLNGKQYIKLGNDSYTIENAITDDQQTETETATATATDMESKEEMTEN
jgi:hypothetical protein